MCKRVLKADAFVQVLRAKSRTASGCTRAPSEAKEELTCIAACSSTKARVRLGQFPVVLGRGVGAQVLCMS